MAVVVHLADPYVVRDRTGHTIAIVVGDTPAQGWRDRGYLVTASPRPPWPSLAHSRGREAALA